MGYQISQRVHEFNLEKIDNELGHHHRSSSTPLHENTLMKIRNGNAVKMVRSKLDGFKSGGCIEINIRNNTKEKS